MRPFAGRPGAAAVRELVGAVLDPEIARPLGELGMVRDVAVDRKGDVVVTIALTTATCPMADQLRADVLAALQRGGVRDHCEIRFATLSDRERLALATTLSQGRRPGPPAQRIYAVASGKGGVGKSTVTANLAVALAAHGLAVGLIDADVWGYSIPHLFGVQRNPVALAGLMLPVPAHGVRLMSVGFLVDPDSPVIWRGPMLHKALEQFLGDVHWGALDVLLLDLPPGTGDTTLSILELLPDAALVAVTTPQPAAEHVALRVARMARDMRMPIAGVVENMSAAACAACGTQAQLFGAGGGQRLATAIDAPLLGQVPFDLPAREAGDAGVPVVVHAPTAASSIEFRRVAGALPTVRRSLVGIPLPLSVA